MKLLFDENLSYRLVPALSDLYGNGPTRVVADLLRARHIVVRRFAEDRESTFLTLPALLQATPPLVSP